jgi:hypothetical protein
LLLAAAQAEEAHTTAIALAAQINDASFTRMKHK